VRAARAENDWSFFRDTAEPERQGRVARREATRSESSDEVILPPFRRSSSLRDSLDFSGLRQTARVVGVVLVMVARVLLGTKSGTVLCGALACFVVGLILCAVSKE
jgi:hypothetical protein